MVEVFPRFDVLIAGGGNAALCAALRAAEQGARVAVLESAPRALRGGNSRHTRNLRCAHDVPTKFLQDSYREQEYFADLMRVTGGETDEGLARRVVRESRTLMEWMCRFGARFQPAIQGTLQLGRTNLFFLGGGKALLNSYYSAAERAGVRVFYDAEVIGLKITDGNFESATVLLAGETIEIGARAFVAATGGFESNLEWLKAIWGDAADTFLVRGTPYNEGKVLRALLDYGAKTAGDPTQCHAVAIDARAPKFDGGIVTRLDSVPLGIAVNQRAERFHDEGEDLWPKRYAIWGRLVAQQPGQMAYSIVDAKALEKFMPSAFPPVRGGTIRELAENLGLPPDALESTVNRFNRAVQPGAFNPEALDDCRTLGLSPEKTHWARKIDTPPFLGFPLRPGLTFTYLGVAVDSTARVVFHGAGPSPNIFAAGEIMAGNILGQGYLAGLGMAIGTVFGRMAGEEAAQVAGEHG